MSATSCRGPALLVGVAVLALLAAAPAFAEPPANDDRANAELLATFPARVQGTTVGATVERLDPQVSDCGRIDGTVWYRIDAAPDGRVVVSAQAADGLAPVVRVYRRTPSAIQERACATAAANGRAVTSFETVRGAGYLIVVGRRPGAVDGSFELSADLFLPPPNDTRGDAEPLGRLPSTVRSSTLGATGGDVAVCGVAGGTVWYRLTGPASGRVALRLTAADELDAVVSVFARVRAGIRPLACARTDDDGKALVAFETRPGRTYYVAVGERRGSSPGAFTLRAVAAEPLEALTGRALSRRGASGTVDGVTDVNDVWAVTLRRGTTYRLAFTAPACGRADVRAPGVRRRDVAPVLRLRCSAYTTFTPGPDGGGRYTIEVTAAPVAGRQRYALRVVRAGPDDIGLGRPLREGRSASGSLSPRGADVVDVFHFAVTQRSEVRIDLRRSSGTSFDLLLLDDAGRRISSGPAVRRRLATGEYVAVVRAAVASSGGRYRLALHLRAVTTTAVSVSGVARAEVAAGTALAIAATVSPAPAGGVVVFQLDRFDPLSGWHFHRLVAARPGAPVSWRPPAPGRWRVRASYRGTSRSSPSRSGYAYVVVRAPLGGR